MNAHSQKATENYTRDKRVSDQILGDLDGAAGRGEHRQAAGAGAEALIATAVNWGGNVKR